MFMQKIDGKLVAEKVLSECKEQIAELKKKGVTPGLSVVLIGEDPASMVYVGSKARKCEELGIFSRKIVMPTESTQEEVMAVVEELNKTSMDSILRMWQSSCSKTRLAMCPAHPLVACACSKRLESKPLELKR